MEQQNEVINTEEQDPISSTRQDFKGTMIGKEFTCDVCGYKTSYSICYKRHCATHTGVKPYKCDECDYACIRSTDLCVHKETYHGEKTVYKCADGITMEEQHSTSTTQDSKDIKNKKVTYTCNVCGYNTFYAVCFKRHSVIHTGARPHKCSVCDYACVRINDLKKHINAHHNGVGIEQHPTSSKKQNNKEIKNRKVHTCDICGYKTIYSICYKRHYLKHTGEKPHKCDVCDYACIRSSDLKKHKLFHHSGVNKTRTYYKCVDCDFQCTTKTSFKEHKLKHAGLKPYKCDICRYATTRRDTLKIHMFNHWGYKPFKCDVCEFRCADRGALRSHKIYHLSDKPYKCPNCSMSFVRPQYLKTHLLSHTGEKPFKCDSCDYVCVSPALLKVHEVKHSDKKLYRCDICAYAFKYKCSLKTHIMLKHMSGRKHEAKHSDVKSYQCDICAYVFKHKSSLKTHMLKHMSDRKSLTKHTPTKTDDRLHKCDMCEYTSSRKIHLRAHLLTHKRQHKCQICDFVSRFKTSLKKHITDQHPAKPNKCIKGRGRGRPKTTRSLKRNQLNSTSYICDICEFKTTTSSCLDRHRKTKHKDLLCVVSECKSENVKIEMTFEEEKDNVDSACDQLKHEISVSHISIDPIISIKKEYESDQHNGINIKKEMDIEEEKCNISKSVSNSLQHESDIPEINFDPQVSLKSFKSEYEEVSILGV